MEDCPNNIIKLPKGPLGVINGLDGYIVVEQGNVLLICKKGDSSALIRKYVNEVGIKYGEEYLMMKAEREGRLGHTVFAYGSKLLVSVCRILLAISLNSSSVSCSFSRRKSTSASLCMGMR